MTNMNNSEKGKAFLKQRNQAREQAVHPPEDKNFIVKLKAFIEKSMRESGLYEAAFNGREDYEQWHRMYDRFNSLLDGAKAHLFKHEITPAQAAQPPAAGEAVAFAEWKDNYFMQVDDSEEIQLYASYGADEKRYTIEELYQLFSTTQTKGGTE